MKAPPSSQTLGSRLGSSRSAYWYEPSLRVLEGILSSTPRGPCWPLGGGGNAIDAIPAARDAGCLRMVHPVGRWECHLVNNFSLRSVRFIAHPSSPTVGTLFEYCHQRGQLLLSLRESGKLLGAVIGSYAYVPGPQNALAVRNLAVGGSALVGDIAARH